MYDWKVEEGDFVSPGQLVGILGKTGSVKGAHLHLSVFIDEDRDFTSFHTKINNTHYFSLTNYVVNPYNNNEKWLGTK